MQRLELLPPPGRALPCVDAGPGLYFSESPRELELAKQLCRPCPLRTRCLEGAKDRGELLLHVDVHVVFTSSGACQQASAC